MTGGEGTKVHREKLLIFLSFLYIISLDILLLDLKMLIIYFLFCFC